MQVSAVFQPGRAGRAAPALVRQHQYTLRVEPLQELAALAAFQPAFSPPFGHRDRNSSHTVRASSIRLKPEQFRTTSRVSVASRALKARPENRRTGRLHFVGDSWPAFAEPTLRAGTS